MRLTIYEVFKCDGCDQRLPDPGLCAACAEEVRALDHIWLMRHHPGAVQLGHAQVIPIRPRAAQHKPELPQWVYGAGAALVVVLLQYIAYAFITKF